MQLRRRSVPLITNAQRSPLEDWRKRRREYAWLQGSRIPFLVAAAVAYTVMHNNWLGSILALISVPLPWIAVVIANAVGEPADKRTPRVYKPALAREQAFLDDHTLAASETRQLPGAPSSTTAPGPQSPGASSAASADMQSESAVFYSTSSGSDSDGAGSSPFSSAPYSDGDEDPGVIDHDELLYPEPDARD